MNSFQTACCRSHPLQRPGVGNRAADVFVRGMVGRGEEARRRAAGVRAREFSQHPPLSRPGPLGGSGSAARLLAEEVVRSQTSPGGPWSERARKRKREKEELQRIGSINS